MSFCLSFVVFSMTIALASSNKCPIEFRCDNYIAMCGEGSECINPSNEALGGCCVPQGMKLDDDIFEGCHPNFACDNEFAHCGEGSECMNPSGAALGGCCQPIGIDQFMAEKEAEEEAPVPVCEETATPCLPSIVNPNATKKHEEL